MKVMLDIKNSPVKGDILIFNGVQFECVSKELFLQKLKGDIFRMTDEITALNNEIKELKHEVNVLKGEE